MLHHPLIQELTTLRLRGMASALEHQHTTPDIAALPFEDRLGLLIQRERAERESLRLQQRLRIAKLPQSACVEDLDTRTTRGLDRSTLTTVRSLGWIEEHLNVLITGPTGVGKSYLASAVAHAACRADYTVRCFRLPRLVDDLAKAHAMSVSVRSLPSFRSGSDGVVRPVADLVDELIVFVGAFDGFIEADQELGQGFAFSTDERGHLHIFIGCGRGAGDGIGAAQGDVAVSVEHEGFEVPQMRQ